MTLEDKFRVYDSFLPDSEYNRLKEIISNKTALQWSWQSSDEYSQHTFMMSDVTDDPFYKGHIFSFIQSCFDSDTILEPLRIYFNAQVPNANGSFHIDDGDVTAILYINEKPYDPSWGGWTQLHNEERDPKKEKQEFISPWCNRLLLFDATVAHRGYAFNHSSCPVRFNLTYKLKAHS